MIAKYVIRKAAVFIDAANILYSQHTLKWRVDYKKLMKYLQAECNLSFVGFYYANISNNKGQQTFFQILKDVGYMVKTKPVKYIKTNKGVIMKGNLDIELACDMIIQKDNYDTCILMSGDSDFEVVVNYLRSVGKQVIVMSTKKHISIEIIRCCNKYINIAKLRSKLERK